MSSEPIGISPCIGILRVEEYYVNGEERMNSEMNIGKKIIVEDDIKSISKDTNEISNVEIVENPFQATKKTR